MAVALIDSAKITDWQSFHRFFAVELGFPDFYGNNMDAWIDCLTYLRDDDAMSRFILQPDEYLDLEIVGAEAFNRRTPELMDALIECTAFVNQRYIAARGLPAIRLIFL